MLEATERRTEEPAQITLRLPQVSGETLLYVAIIGLALVIRFWDLGTRVLHHDESIHAVQSFKIYMGSGYRHDPVFHGQFLYWANALVYFLLGASDYTARVAPALTGTIMVGLPYLLRERLGRGGALVASLILAVSPSIVYYSRSLRHDIYAATATLILVIALWRYVNERRPRWLYLAAGGLVLGFTNHELTYITVFILVTFLLLFFALRLIMAVLKTDPSHPAHNGKLGMELLKVRFRDSKESLSPYWDFFMLLATVAGPLFAVAALIAPQTVTGKPLPNQQDVLLGIGFLVVLAIASGVGFWWKRSIWLGAAAIFWIPFLLIFSGFFSDPGGFFTGAIGALQYWLTQHSFRRGDQPPYYYFMLLPIYEFVSVIFGLAGTLYSALRSNVFSDFLVYWAFASLVIYSWAGEKMPWLVIHIALPFAILSAYFLGRLMEKLDWRRAVSHGGPQLLGSLLITIFVVSALAYLSAPERPLRPGEENFVISERVVLFVILAALIAIAVSQLNRLGTGPALRLIGLGAFAVLTVLTARASIEANFYNTDTPIEMLIYTQSAPDIRGVMKEIERVGFATGQGKDLKVAYDSSVTWPFEWYLRDYKNRNFFAMGTPAPDAPVVLVGFEDDHASKVKPLLNDYVGQRYKLRWWFPEDYRTGFDWIRAMQSEQTRKTSIITSQEMAGPLQIIQASLGPEGLTRLWRYFLYREPFNPLGSTDFMLYIRSDLAGAAVGNVPVAKEKEKPSAPPVNTIAVSAVRSFGSPGVGDGQLRDPKGIAVAPDGSVYIAEAGNKRMQRFGSSGQAELKWGTPGSGEGEFNSDWGPWGVAVDNGGNVFVADMWNHRIQKFDKSGQFTARWGSQGAGPGEFFGPRGIALDAVGNVYVTDTGNHRVQKFDNNGRFIGQFGGRGAGDGQFAEPVGIAIDSEGSILVADTWNHRIQKFTPDFKPMNQWAVPGWDSESITNKPYLAVDASDNVYATDPQLSRAYKFSPGGSLLTAWGKYGTDTSSFNLPTGIAVDRDGNILVADSLNNRVLVFGPIR